MPKQNLQLVNFNKGLITEANPLNQPLGSTRAEQNFTIENDGTRDRRLGMCYESSWADIPVDLTLGSVDYDEVGYSTFMWDITGEVDGLFLVVIQIANTLYFFESTEGSLTPNYFTSRTFSIFNGLSWGITQVNSTLVVATGDNIVSIKYDNGTLVTDAITLEVRDFFGLEDVEYGSGIKLDEGNNISKRVDRGSPEQGTIPTGEWEAEPDLFTREHYYNLLNQGWPEKKVWTQHTDGSGKIFRSPLDASGYTNLPSNADVYARYVVAITEERPRHIETFSFEDFVGGEGDLSNSLSPRGKVIVELMNRGTSRNSFSDLDTRLLEHDYTPGGAKVVAEFAGRAFYAGFSGEVVEGDIRSPKLNNYVAFSQLVEQDQKLGRCHQEADPTNADDNEIVDTDGGLVRISEATKIVGLKTVGNSLLVFAENGVWQIVGGSDYGFSATNYQVVKVTERGCLSSQSIVVVGESVLYWSAGGIYICESGDTGYYVSKDLTEATIRTFYENIDSKTKAFGRHDPISKKVSWVYGDGTELVLNLSFGAWSINEISKDTIKIKGILEAPSFVGGKYIDPVTVSGGVVTVSGEDVVVTTGISLSSKVSTKYLAVNTGENTFSFSEYDDLTFTDWGCYPTAAVDAYAYMQGAHFTGGVGNREKQSPYITFHFNKTEDGFDAEYEPTNQSSCLVQTSWDWSNGPNSNKQGKEFQAYRFRRHYIPQDNTDGYDNGYETVVTKSKVRGRGKALSVLIKTEPLKNCQLIGWEQEVTMNEN